MTATASTRGGLYALSALTGDEDRIFKWRKPQSARTARLRGSRSSNDPAVTLEALTGAPDWIFLNEDEFRPFCILGGVAAASSQLNSVIDGDILWPIAEAVGPNRLNVVLEQSTFEAPIPLIASLSPESLYHVGETLIVSVLPAFLTLRKTSERPASKPRQINQYAAEKCVDAAWAALSSDFRKEAA